MICAHAEVEGNEAFRISPGGRETAGCQYLGVKAKEHPLLRVIACTEYARVLLLEVMKSLTSPPLFSIVTLHCIAPVSLRRFQSQHGEETSAEAHGQQTRAVPKYWRVV